MTMFSESLRQGGRKFPQRCARTWCERRGDQWAVDALGAMAAGLGWEPGQPTGKYERQMYRALGEPDHCPLCGSGMTTYFVIAHLSDRHGWTTDEIAGWLEP